MTNKKFKPGRVQTNMKARAAFKELGRNKLTFLLACRSSGIGINRVISFDRETMKQEFERFTQDSRDDVLKYKTAEFLKSVNLPQNRFDEYVMLNNVPYLKEMGRNGFTPKEFDVVINELSEYLVLYMLLLNKYFGYGHKRIDRVMRFMETYKGDPFKECTDVFGYTYRDENELSDIYAYDRRERRMDRVELQQKRREMQAVKLIQEGKQ